MEEGLEPLHGSRMHLDRELVEVVELRSCEALRDESIICDAVFYGYLILIIARYYIMVLSDGQASGSRFPLPPELELPLRKLKYCTVRKSRSRSLMKNAAHPHLFAVSISTDW